VIAAAALLAALYGAPAVRARALEPLFAREEREHHLPRGLLAKVARRESMFRVSAIGDHGRAFGLFQVHSNALPRTRLTPAQLMRPDVNAHAAALRLVLARRRCHGGIAAMWAANFNGRRCGTNPYRIAAR
jgi:hypothetical protein